MRPTVTSATAACHEIQMTVTIISSVMTAPLVPAKTQERPAAKGGRTHV